MSKYLKPAFKLVVGFALIFYVFRSKMVDFEIVKTRLLDPINLLVSFGFLAFSMLCCATRWHFLARAQGLSLSFRNLIELTMIGNFFNSFMPGSVGGDLIKAWYVAGREPQRKTRAIFTVLLDRAIGLSVIVFYSAATLVFYTKWIEGRHQLMLVALTIWAFSGTCFLVAFLFFSPLPWKRLGEQKPVKALLRWRRLSDILEAGLIYRSHLPTIVLAITLSGASVFAINWFYKFEGDGLGIAMGTAQYFFIVPLALVATAIPLFPGGIGVGQVAFFTLFSWMGMPKPEQGATLCTLMQAYSLMFNCLGAFFYIRFRRHPERLPHGLNEEKPAVSAAFIATPA